MENYFELNPESKPFLDRLVTEWEQHGKIIIACDYDDTISPWKTAKFTGAYLVIFTACDTQRYDEIKSYCKSKDLEIDSINQTPIDLPYGKNGKVYANIFIDDRAGLNESLNILESATYIIRGKSQKYFEF